MLIVVALLATGALYILALVAMKCRRESTSSTVVAFLCGGALATFTGLFFSPLLTTTHASVFYPLTLALALLPVAFLPLVAERTIPWALKEQKHVVILKDERQLSDHWKSETWRKEEMEDDALYLDNDGLERLYGDEYKARRKASRLTLHTLRLSVLARLFNEDVGELRDLFAQEVEEYRRRYELLTGKAFQ